MRVTVAITTAMVVPPVWVVVEGDVGMRVGKHHQSEEGKERELKLIRRWRWEMRMESKRTGRGNWMILSHVSDFFFLSPNLAI